MESREEIDQRLAKEYQDKVSDYVLQERLTFFANGEPGLQELIVAQYSQGGGVANLGSFFYHREHETFLPASVESSSRFRDIPEFTDKFEVPLGALMRMTKGDLGHLYFVPIHEAIERVDRECEEQGGNI